MPTTWPEKVIAILFNNHCSSINLKFGNGLIVGSIVFLDDLLMLRVKMIKGFKNVRTIFVYRGVRLIMNDKTSVNGVKYSLQHTSDLSAFS